ncbi:MAG: helix-turn-helix transcriptional regulator [Yoonia sp.]|nr:helix-turn-helix transcriptional regulator [Yoonia sp.]
MTNVLSDLPNTLERIYDAAFKETLIEVILDTISAQLPGMVVVLLGQDSLRPAGNFLLNRGLKADAVSPIMAGLAVGNSSLDRLWEQKCGEIYHDNDLMSRDTLVASSKARHWHEMMGSMVRSTGMVINRQQTRQLVLEIRFPENNEAKSRRVATELLNTLGPHIVSAARIMRLNVKSSANAQLTCDVIDLFPFPMVIVDKKCKVYGVNGRAEALADKMETFFISADREFHAVNLDAQLKLRSVIEQLCAGFRHATEIIALPNSDNTKQVSLSLTKLDHHAQRQLGPKDMYERHGARVALVIQDTTEPLKISHRALWSAFKLTNAESDLALLLLEGFSVGECAHQQRLAKQTLRNHLGAIMKKTHTNRQPQLVALLTRLALSTIR